MNPDIIGFLAALVSTGSLAPQVYKTSRSRSAGDFSYAWLSTALAGGAMVMMILAMKRQHSKTA